MTELNGVRAKLKAYKDEGEFGFWYDEAIALEQAKAEAIRQAQSGAGKG